MRIKEIRPHWAHLIFIVVIFSAAAQAPSCLNIKRLRLADTIAGDSQPQPVLWLDAGEGVTFDGGNNISQWDDQSGNGFHAVQSGSQPQYIANGGAGFNNLPVVDCDVGQIAGLIVPRMQGRFADGYTSFIVFGSSSGQPGWNQVFYGAYDTSGKRLFHFGTNGAGALSYVLQDGTNTFWLGGATLNAGAVPATLHVAKVDPANTEHTGYLNGTSIGSTALTGLDWAGAQTQHTESFGVCKQAIDSVPTGNSNNGFIAEILIYGSALTDSQRQTVECYLANKYAITVPGC